MSITETVEECGNVEGHGGLRISERAESRELRAEMQRF
jgi:hypothetical protein